MQSRSCYATLKESILHQDYSNKELTSWCEHVKWKLKEVLVGEEGQNCTSSLDYKSWQPKKTSCCKDALFICTLKWIPRKSLEYTTWDKTLFPIISIIIQVKVSKWLTTSDITRMNKMILLINLVHRLMLIKINLGYCFKHISILLITKC